MNFAVLRLYRKIVKLDKFCPASISKFVTQECISYWCIAIVVQVLFPNKTQVVSHSFMPQKRSPVSENILHTFRQINSPKAEKLSCDDTYLAQPQDRDHRATEQPTLFLSE